MAHYSANVKGIYDTADLKKQLIEKRKELNEEDTNFPHIQEVIDAHWND